MVSYAHRSKSFCRGEDTLFVAIDDEDAQLTFFSRLQEYVGDWKRE